MHHCTWLICNIFTCEFEVSSKASFPKKKKKRPNNKKNQGNIRAACLRTTGELFSFPEPL
jgi:hypothetical protein